MNAVYPWKEAPEAEFCVIGDPVAHSLSPRMHTAAYRRLGLPHRYVAVHVPRGEVGQALDRLKALGYIGVNVTVPHKEEALFWSRDREPFAQEANAANTIRLSDQACRNSDGPGFLNSVALILDPKRPILMLGAGGSSRSIALALCAKGAKLLIWNRTESKARELAQRVGAQWVSSPNLRDVSIVLNTTSASLLGDSLSLDWSQVAEDALAYDLAYTDGLTPFLAEAARNGVRTQDGRRLLVEQGALSFEWWLGVDAPRQAMMEAL